MIILFISVNSMSLYHDLEFQAVLGRPSTADCLLESLILEVFPDASCCLVTRVSSAYTTCNVSFRRKKLEMAHTWLDIKFNNIDLWKMHAQETLPTNNSKPQEKFVI